MASTEHPCAASSLLVPVFDVGALPLVEVARTRVSVHYETGLADLPVLSVCTPDAVRLPNSLVVWTLPGAGSAGSAMIMHGRLCVAATAWVVSRWWRPRRPHRSAPALPRVRPVEHDSLRPTDLVGRGPGLTPAGDDVVAGALVAAYATSDPRRESWVRQTRRALHARRTTAVSHAMLHHAIAGYATPRLAAYVDAVVSGSPADDARRRLLDVGHTSGAALVQGVDHALGAGVRGAA